MRVCTPGAIRAIRDAPSHSLHDLYSCFSSVPSAQQPGIGRDQDQAATVAAHKDLLFQGPPHSCLLLQDCQLSLPNPFSQ